MAILLLALFDYTRAAKLACRADLFAALSVCWEERADNRAIYEEPDWFTTWQDCERTAREERRACVEAIEE